MQIVADTAIAIQSRFRLVVIAAMPLLQNGGRQRARPMWFPFAIARCRAPLHGVVIRAQ